MLSFFCTHTDSTIFRYSHAYYLIPVLARILPFSGTLTNSTFFGTRPDSFSVVVQILHFPDTCSNSTIFRYSSGQFFGPFMDSTFSRYSPGFYNFPVLTLILPFSETHPDCFSIGAQILPFPGFYQFRVLTLILPFSETHPNSL